MSTTQKLCILSDVFHPGYKTGGPARSCLNLAQSLEISTEIFVFCSDRDLHQSTSYPNIVTDQWINIFTAIKVYYASPKQQGIFQLFSTLKKINADAIYLNSLFSLVYAIFPLIYKRLGILPSKIVLAPRGMLKTSALNIKPLKKKIFISLLKWFNIHKQILFHATSEEEAAEIKQIFGNQVSIYTIPVLPEINLINQRQTLKKQDNYIRLCYISRIHPIKNLHSFLLSLPKINTTKIIDLDVVGPEEDSSYTAYCKSIATQLPAHITVHFKGDCTQKQAIEHLQKSHFFVLLTLGENFGHAIFEALALGKPVLISDQTPWIGLSEKHAGWDIPLNNQEKLISSIETMCEMDEHTYEKWSDSAYMYVKDFIRKTNWNNAYMSMFFDSSTQYSL